jgi:RNA polymerase sigma-70 factor (ECF subfamily)
MDSQGLGEVTRLLQAWNQGQGSALEDLLPLIYEELRQRAHGYMYRERPGHLLETAALINEAFLRLLDLQKVDWQNRDQFFAASARLMRRILVDYARQRDARKRGGEAARVTLESGVLGAPGLDFDMLELDESLQVLADFDSRKAQVVELRFFGGLTVGETAVLLGVSNETVQRDWKFAKAWLFDRLQPVSES